jgi:hypothetical protein
MVANYTTHDSELQSPTEITIRCQTKGWTSNELVKNWLQGVWIRRPGGVPKKLAILPLNALTGHLTPAIKATITGSSLNTNTVVITQRMTSQLQVLDVVVNKPLRDHLRQLQLYN